VLVGALALPWVRPRDRLELPLDVALVCLVAGVALQTVPLSRPLLELLSPHALEAREILFLTRTAAAVVPLSIDGRATAIAFAMMAAALGVFWAGRRVATAGAAPMLARGIATVGVVAAFAALVQRAIAPELISGLWQPEDPLARPFGAFVNRNHYATWLLLAIPLTIGSIVREIAVRVSNGIPRRVLAARIMDSPVPWLVLAGGLMLLALVLSLSRSGYIGLTVAAGAAVLLARPRPRWTTAVACVFGAVLLPAVVYVDFSGVLARMDTTTVDAASRLTIWSDTIPVIRNFWISGSGSGTYGLAMLIYQQADRAVFFNQAHNHYLQLVAEGGLLLLIPTGVALLALTATVWRRLREDKRSTRWIRAGAACGLLAVGVQSLWETGLRMPANAVLCGIVAAIAVAQREDRNPEDPGAGRQLGRASAE
jgi:O-antigen ligase